MTTLKYVVEYIQFPLNTDWTSVDTVACVSTYSELREFFEGEIRCSIDADLSNEIADILDGPFIPKATNHYRVSVTYAKRARCFVDQTNEESYPEFFAKPDSFNGSLYRGHCKNHPECTYLTKGPGRSLHYVGHVRECSCSINDLMINTNQG